MEQDIYISSSFEFCVLFYIYMHYNKIIIHYGLHVKYL